MKILSGKGLFLALCVWSGVAQAGVTVGGTRVVYDGGKREATLSVRNGDKIPFLIQAWTDDDGPDGENKGGAKPPFIVTPPLFRLDPNAENLMRIIRTGGNLPEDRESIFWMNVKSIPSAPDSAKNVLQIAVKTRIKLFYRPVGLKAPTDDTYKQLSFQRQGDQLQVTNPTPYYLSFNTLTVGNATVDATRLMAPPKGTTSAKLPSGANGGQVSWTIINDFGGKSPAQTAPLR